MRCIAWTKPDPTPLPAHLFALSILLIHTHLNTPLCLQEYFSEHPEEVNRVAALQKQV